MNFFKEERRIKLSKELAAFGMAAQMIEQVTSFPEKEADNCMYAHARICAKHSEDGGNPEFLALSALFLLYMEAEATERGLKKADFPRASNFIDQAIYLKNGHKTH